MSGDGVSLQTNLVQLGNVAKTNARAAQAPHGATPANEPADRREIARLHRVNEAEKSERQHVDPDRRRERDHKRQPGDEAAGDGEATAAGPSAAADEEAAPPAGVGGLFDRKA